MGVLAADEKKAVIKFETVNVRKGAGLDYDVKAKLPQGTELKVVSEKDISDGYTWYKVSFLQNKETVTGWVRSDCITIISTGASDENFEAYLKSQDFPESYKQRLRVLHEQYPKWIFQAQHTGLKWDDVIAAETKLGMNLVHGTSISSWKSTQTGAYDWENSSWKSFDSGGWVMASKELVCYYIDPRNMLDDVNVFQFLRQSYDASLQNATGMANVVKGTFLAGTYEEGSKKIKYTDTLMEAAKQSGVSPYTLASMIIIEQGADGSGNSICGTVKGYKGYYNFLNIHSYPEDGRTAVENGLWYAKGGAEGKETDYNRPWNTRTKSIIGGAIFYGEKYVAVGQDTLYLKKFNVQGKNPYTHQYMTNIEGAVGEGQRLSEAFNETARDSALIFKIPVYTNMPDKLCVKPTGDGSPNNMLKSLNVKGQSLSPTFDMYINAYSLIVGNEVSSVRISATAYDTTAVISGKGTVTLKVGKNVQNVTVKAQNGDTRTYKITIVREQGEGGASPVLSTKAYRLDEKAMTISGIKEFPIKASKFKKQFAITDGAIQITDAKGKAFSGNIGTGTLLKVYDNNEKLVSTYKIILFGDTNGDGDISMMDYVQIRKNIIGTYSFVETFAKAADTSKNGKVDMMDYVQIRKYILKQFEIIQ